MIQARPIADPIDACRAACARSPGDATPFVKLARALLAANRAAEAIVPAEQAVAVAPKFAAARKARDAVLAAIMAGDPDLVRLELASALEPNNAEAHLALGQAYVDANRPHDAEHHYKRALTLGHTRDANAVLAALYLAMQMLDAAEHHALAVLEGPDRGEADDLLVAMAHQTLAGVLEARGDAAAATAGLDQAYARRSLFRQPAPGSPFTTLVLVTTGAGNIPYKTLLPPARWDCVMWYMEHARPDQFAKLPDHALVLNAIGDPDLATASDPMVDAFLEISARPVLNRPERVRATFRHRLPQTLAGLIDVIVPPTARVSGQAVAEYGLPRAAAEAGLAAPLLVRPTASHGGLGLVLARDDAELAALTPPVGDDAYLTQFHDYRSLDGYFRKYRMIFVDRRPWPYHLAISPHWMVHHVSSEMGGDAARMAEEMAFLRDPAGAIGARGLAAIEAIGARLDLDYGGVDFTVTAEGQVLVFEANATMLTHLEPEDGPFAAKNAFIRPIIEAFQGHVRRVANL
jgi:tetratricopeptide (TPR) repeat protein